MTTVRGAAAIAFLVLASVGAVPVGAGAAEASPEGAANEILIYVPSPKNRRDELQLRLFPAKGIAVANTFFSGAGRDREDNRSVSYAIAIPPSPFDGSLDLSFPGLGEFVGTVTPDGPSGPAAQAKLCERSYPEESATFEGHLDFRGAGGYGRWKASKAGTEIVLACGAQSTREDGPAALFRHVAELGPTLIGPAPIRLFAHGEVRHRILEFIAWGGFISNDVEFVAIDREWLPGEVATERWVKQAPVPLNRTVTLDGEAAEPPLATFTPPAPFFGKGTFRRRTGSLTGSLGVHFLGLKLRLTPSPLPATLANEGPPRRSK